MELKTGNKKIESKNRMIYIDILNILAMICVVALHCNGIVHSYTNSTAWATSLIVEVVCFWAVPVFLMITGATLMNYRSKYDTKIFFKKRVMKVVIPFVFWAIVMLVWRYLNGWLSINSFSLKEIANIIFTNGEESTYYFIFIILGIYLTLPLLACLTDEKYRKTLWYGVIVMFITQSVFPVIGEIFGINYNNNLSIQLGSYILFVLLGYLLSTQEIKKEHRIIIYILGILSMLFRYIMTYYFSTKMQTVYRTLFGYPQFHSVFLACSVFVFIKNMKLDFIRNNQTVTNILAQVSSCSFGIYLIHKIVMHYQIELLNIDMYSWQWRIFGIISTYMITLGIVYVLKKVPLLNKIVP